MPYNPYFGKTLLNFEKTHFETLKNDLAWWNCIHDAGKLKVRTEEQVVVCQGRKSKTTRTEIHAYITLTVGEEEEQRKTVFKFVNEGDYPENGFTYEEATGNALDLVLLAGNSSVADSFCDHLTAHFKFTRSIATPEESLFDICEYIRKAVEAENAKHTLHKQQEFSVVSEPIKPIKVDRVAQSREEDLLFSDDSVYTPLPTLTFDVHDYTSYSKSVDCGFTLHPSEQMNRAHEQPNRFRVANAEIKFFNPRRQSIKTVAYNNGKLRSGEIIEVLKKQFPIGKERKPNQEDGEEVKPYQKSDQRNPLDENIFFRGILLAMVQKGMMMVKSKITIW